MWKCYVSYDINAPAVISSINHKDFQEPTAGLIPVFKLQGTCLTGAADPSLHHWLMSNTSQM